MRTIRITGTGSALPGRIVTNKELEQLVETSDEWIRERTGIAERHVSVGETVVTLASEAARKALERAGKRAEEIDLILVATCSPEQYLPCCACQVHCLRKRKRTAGRLLRKSWTLMRIYSNKGNEASK